jgi:hypothetical protein
MVLSSPFLLCKEQHYLHNLFRLDLKVLLLDDEAIDIQMYLQTVAVELTGRRSIDDQSFPPLPSAIFPPVTTATTSQPSYTSAVKQFHSANPEPIVFQIDDQSR